MAKICRNIALMGCVAFFTGTAVLAADWPQWRGANRDGKVTEFAAPASWPRELTQKWKVTVGAGDSTPALVGDKLYVFTREGNDEVTTCLDAATGKQVWQDKYAPNMSVQGAAAQHPGTRSSPAVAEGKVVTLGVGEMLSCLDAASGKVVWRKEFTKEFSKTFPKFYSATSPIIVSGMAITHLGTEGKGAVMAFDLTTGDVKWKWEGDGPCYGSPNIMTLDGTKMIVDETEKSIVGLNLADGKLLWQFTFGGGGGMGGNNTSTPVVDGPTVYASGGSGTRAMRIEKQGEAFAARELWSNPQAAIQYNTPVLVNDMLFGFSNRSMLFCLSAKDGKTLWTDSTNYNARGFGSVVSAGPVLFLLTQKADLVAFQPGEQGFKELAKYKIAGSETYAYPVISGKNVIIKDLTSVTLYELQ